MFDIFQHETKAKRNEQIQTGEEQFSSYIVKSVYQWPETLVEYYSLKEDRVINYLKIGSVV